MRALLERGWVQLSQCSALYLDYARVRHFAQFSLIFAQFSPSFRSFLLKIVGKAVVRAGSSVREQWRRSDDEETSRSVFPPHFSARQMQRERGEKMMPTFPHSK